MCTKCLTNLMQCAPLLRNWFTFGHPEQMIQLVVREMTTLVRVYVREHFVCVSILHGGRCIPTTSLLAAGQACSLNYV